MMFLSLFSGVEGALREAHRQINSSQDGLHDVPRRISVGNRPPASGQDPEFTADTEDGDCEKHHHQHHHHIIIIIIIIIIITLPPQNPSIQL